MRHSRGGWHVVSEKLFQPCQLRATEDYCETSSSLPLGWLLFQIGDVAGKHVHGCPNASFVCCLCRSSACQACKLKGLQFTSKRITFQSCDLIRFCCMVTILSTVLPPGFCSRMALYILSSETISRMIKPPLQQRNGRLTVLALPKGYLPG